MFCPSAAQACFLLGLHPAPAPCQHPAWEVPSLALLTYHQLLLSSDPQSGPLRSQIAARVTDGECARRGSSGELSSPGQSMARRGHHQACLARKDSSQGRGTWSLQENVGPGQSPVAWSCRLTPPLLSLLPGKEPGPGRGPMLSQPEVRTGPTGKIPFWKKLEDEGTRLRK